MKAHFTVVSCNKFTFLSNDIINNCKSVLLKWLSLILRLELQFSIPLFLCPIFCIRIYNCNLVILYFIASFQKHPFQEKKTNFKKVTDGHTDGHSTLYVQISNVFLIQKKRYSYKLSQKCRI